MLELGRNARTSIPPTKNRAVMKRTHEKYRQRGKSLAIGSRADVGGERHLANIEPQPANHSAEGIGENRDFLELELAHRRRDRALLERTIVALRA